MSFFEKVLQIYTSRWPWFLELIGEQLKISLIAVLLAGILGMLLGIFIAEHRRFAEPVMAVCNVFYTIPAIALIGLLIPLIGIGERNAIIAIVLYGIMPMVRNTYTGITNINASTIDAALGLGSTKRQIMFRIRLPLAASVIIAGLRNVVVMSIATGSIAAFVGGGGLGEAIFRGITMYNTAMTFAGSLLLVLLALICDYSLSRLEKHIKKKWRVQA
ncbi:MAG: ABC transporter permease [Oscillospiraceae bacterium]|nr:ABC transporter permease [Oscillospiraceae bacterium]